MIDTKLSGDTLTVSITGHEDLAEFLLDCPEFWRLAEDSIGFRRTIHKSRRSEAKFTGEIELTVTLPIEDEDELSDREMDLRDNAVRGGV